MCKCFAERVQASNPRPHEIHEVSLLMPLGFRFCLNSWILLVQSSLVASLKGDGIQPFTAMPRALC